MNEDLDKTQIFKEEGAKEFIIKTFASGLGTGYSPVASGTAGSLLAVAIWWFVPEMAALKIAITCVVLAASIPISTAAELLYGKKDDSRIVIDEVVGMWVSVAFLPHTIKYYAAAFLLFRLFDVIKPFGIRKIQSLNGGWGVVMDDFFAGLLANVVVRIAAYAASFI